MKTTLLLSKTGDICYFSNEAKREILLNDDDLANFLFSPIIIKTGYTVESLFRSLIKYPILQKLFPIIKDYILEYESITESVHNDFILVVSSVNTIFNNRLDIKNKIEIYDENKNYYSNVDISLMPLSNYINYSVSFNELSAIETFEDDNLNQIIIDYFEFNFEENFNLISFFKVLIDNISLHGCVSERNAVIQSLYEERKELELESDAMAADIMLKINGEQKND
jgi:hypothetical protein